MTAPVRLRLSRAKGFNLQASSKALNGLPAINVSRPSGWGNPYIVGQDGTRAECVHYFRCLFGGYYVLTCKTPVAAQREFVRHAAAFWGELRNRNLACWCPLGVECHADVLLEMANRVKCEEVA
jgi:hypothetical protein